MSLIFRPAAGALVFAVGVIGALSPALAGPTCTHEPQEKWLGSDQMKERIAKMGYRNIRTFKTTSGNCYEIYGFDSEGRRVEVYFNPVDGQIVREKVEH